MSRVLPHPLAVQCEVCELSPAASAALSLVTIHEWDAGRWFVADSLLGMLGEIERTGNRYEVLHSDDAKGAVFAFASLTQATLYFEEYAAALTL